MRSPRKLWQQTVTIRLVLFVVAASLLAGCMTRDAREDKVLKENDDLITGYLEGSLAEARSCLQKEIDLLENDTAVNRHGRAVLLADAYYRLCVLERWAGNRARADAAFIKGQYWNLIGDDDDENALRVQGFTEARIAELIEKQDRHTNDGKLPRYRYSDSGP